MSRTTTLTQALKVLDRRAPMRVIDWALQHGFTESGQPYNDWAYPHLSAPGGPFDAYDCQMIFDIWLQWASRLGKTFGGQTCMLKQADCDPCPMMFASADEKLAVEVVERTYGMIKAYPALSDLLPPPNRRRQSKIDLRFCRIYVAWSRSVSTLADKAARVIHSNECDKWEHQSTSREADPFQLADERTKEFPTYKRWKEGTPQEKGKSRVERGRLRSCNASLWVPCVHCWKYQVLEFGDAKTKHGVKWDRNEVGKSEPELAKRTSRYVCRHCDEEIYDEHRGTMMRLGVWVPEGCGVDDAEAKRCAEIWREPGRAPWTGWKDSPWITGAPLRDSSEWGSKLSSLYALSLTWGDIAAKFISSKDKPYELRNFKNSWLADTWENTARKTTWEILGGRVIVKDDKLPRCTVPAWASLLTLGIDRQSEGGDRMPWVVDAWGPEDRVHTVAYGEAESFEDLRDKLILPTWNYEDGGSLRIAFGLMDSGHKPHGVHDFCIDMQTRHASQIHACKGSNQALTSEYSAVKLGENTARPGAVLIHVDTIRSQLWIEQQLTTDSAFSIHSGSLLEHQDFLEQLLNDAAVHKLDNSNHARESWNRVDENIPNDYRDCRRYAWVARLIHLRGRPVPPRVDVPPPKRTSVVASGFGGREGGSWL